MIERYDLVLGRDSFAVDQEIPSPLYAEPFWGGYYGKEPYVKVYQVETRDSNDE